MALVHTEINSTNLQSFDYDEDRGVLIVTFGNGHSYAYEGVPKEIHATVLTAESAGAAFHKLIRNGGFEFKKL